VQPQSEAAIDGILSWGGPGGAKAGLPAHQGQTVLISYDGRPAVEEILPDEDQNGRDGPGEYFGRRTGCNESRRFYGLLQYERKVGPRPCSWLSRLDVAWGEMTKETQGR
jgi:hypothetical protein